MKKFFLYIQHDQLPKYLSNDQISSSYDVLKEKINNANYFETSSKFDFDQSNSVSFKTRRNREISLTEYYDLVYEYTSVTEFPASKLSFIPSLFELKIFETLIVLSSAEWFFISPGFNLNDIFGIKVSLYLSDIFKRGNSEFISINDCSSLCPLDLYSVVLFPDGAKDYALEYIRSHINKLIS